MRISKDKYNLLAYGLIITNALILLSLPAFVFNIVPTTPDAAMQKLNDAYKFKDTESKFWNSVKGIQSDTAQASNDSSASNLTQEIKPTQTLTPSPTIISTPTQTPIPTPLPKIQNPTVLLMGDSMMLEGYGPELERALLKYPTVNVIRKGKYSTGLNKISYYDWFAAAESYLKEFKPDIAIVVFGGNDGQPITDDDGKVYPYSPNNQDWINAYSKRVDRMIKILETYTKFSYWTGHPMTNSPDFGPKLKTMNSVYKAESAKSEKVFYVDPDPIFSPNGVYNPYVADENGLKQLAKASDGVHLTPHGGKVLAAIIIKMMSDKVELI